VNALTLPDLAALACLCLLVQAAVWVVGLAVYLMIIEG
jgi:hypothetical protein